MMQINEAIVYSAQYRSGLLGDAMFAIVPRLKKAPITQSTLRENPSE